MLKLSSSIEDCENQLVEKLKTQNDRLDRCFQQARELKFKLKLEQPNSSGREDSSPSTLLELKTLLGTKEQKIHALKSRCIEIERALKVK